MSKNKITLKC